MDIIHSQSSNEDLLCCRACLETDCKLFNIHEYNHSEAFFRISGTPVSKDRLPQYLCTHCRTLLLKCLSFKDMCLQTEQLLQRELLNGELNTDWVRRIDRPHRLVNLTLSIVQIMDCVDNPHTEDIKEEPIDINNTDVPTIDTAIPCEVNMEIDEVNLSETTIDEVNLDAPNTGVNNLGALNTDKAHIDTVSIDSGKRKADSEIELVKKKNKVNEFVVNKMKSIKTYKRNTTTAKKKMDIEIQAYSDKVNDKLDKNETNIDLVTAMDKANINVSYKSINTAYASIIHDDIGESDIDDINEVKGHMNIVDVDSVLKKAVKKTKTCKRNIGITVKKNTENSKDNSDNADMLASKPVKQVKMRLKKDKVKIKSNTDNIVADVFVVNKLKSIKAYKRNTATAKKKMDIEIQAYNDKVNDELDKNETNIDLDTAMDKANINVSYKSINTAYASINPINVDIGESDVDDINEVKGHMNIVDVDSILKKAVKKTKTCKRNIGFTVKKNTENSKDNSDNAGMLASKPVKQVKKRRKKDKVKIKSNTRNVVADLFVANKLKSIKTYKRNTATVKKKMDIEIQAYSDKVNDELDKNETNIDLDIAMDKANTNVSYKSINTGYASIFHDDIGESDVDDINEVEGHMYIVDVDSILNKALKNTKTCKRNIGITVKKNTENSEDNSHNSEPVKQVKRRRKKNRKIKYRNPDNDYLPEFDFAKFESDYGVKIVTLSKQEQLEEIAARKQSANYKTARFPCADCGKGFDMEPAYNNHRRRHSPSAGAHACEVCLVRFRLASLRHAHQDLHRLKFVCECGFVSRARWTAKNHHELHRGRSFFCKHCGKGFSKPTSCLSHVRLSHPALNVACGACGETFVSEQGLKQHTSMMHSEIMKPQQFKCTTCSASFVSSDALDRHTDGGAHGGSACEQCGESCASEDALQAHVGERHPSESHRCEECRATFSSAAAFSTHFRRKHLNERYQLSAAARAARSLAPRRPAPRRAPPRGQFVCEQCGHMAPNAALLRYHQNGHLAVKPFPCPHCPKTFATNSARTSHSRLHTRKGEKPHKCKLCSLTFTEKSNLKRHHSVVHLGVHDNASCHVCARVFTVKHNLRLHINSVHNGQPWPKRERRRKLAKD